MTDLKKLWSNAVEQEDPAATLLSKRKEATVDHEYLRSQAESDHQLAMDHCEVAFGRKGPVLLDWARDNHDAAYSKTLPIALAGPTEYSNLKAYLDRIHDLMLEFIGRDPSFVAFGLPDYKVVRARSEKLHLMRRGVAICGTSSTWEDELEDAWWRNAKLERCSACIGSMCPDRTENKVLHQVYASLPKHRTDQGVIDFE